MTKGFIKSEDLQSEKILLMLRKKYDLKVIREEKQKQKLELHKAIYNLSLDINELEKEIDMQLIKILGRDG